MFLIGNNDVTDDDDDEQNNDHCIPSDEIDDILAVPPQEEEIRWSMRQRQPSIRYSPHEYVMLTLWGQS